MSELEPGNVTPVASVEVSTTEGNFLGSLSEDLRGEASLQDFSDINGLAKSYVSSQRMLGGSIRIPGEDASAEAHTDFYTKVQSIEGVVKVPSESSDAAGWDNLYNKMGRPTEATGYQLNVPEGTQVNENMLTMAHELGLTNSQVNKYMEFEAGQQSQINETQVQARETAQSALKESWGQDYNNRMDGAKAAIRTYSEKYPDAVNELINGPAGNNPALLNMLSDLYGGLQEKGIISSTASSVQYGMSSEEALGQIQEIRGNSAHAAFNSADPGHASAVQKMSRLYQVAYGE